MDDQAKINKVIEKVKSSTSQRISVCSKSFWDQLGVKRRTPNLIRQVEEYLVQSGVEIILEGHEFGKEPDDQRISLKFWYIPVPDDQWFEEMSAKSFENEQEVDVFFLSPLFSKLGYEEVDYSFECKVDISSKFSKRRKGDRLEKVDLVLFDGTDRSQENILVVCEAKKPDIDTSMKMKNLTEAVEESLFYCVKLNRAKRRVATNGDVVRVYRVDPHSPDLLFETHRSELKQRWHQFYLCLGKPVLLEEK